jgi:TonB-linked SusC/RagA family outer membrane protein
MRKPILNFNLLLILCLFIPITGYAQTSRRLDLSLKEKTLREFFQMIESQTEFTFMYNNIDLNQTVSIDVIQTPLDNILKTVLTPKSLIYEIRNRQILIKDAPPMQPVQPARTITGTVTDERGDPVIGANIVEKGTTNGVITDMNGKFSLLVADNATLEMTYIGYIAQSMSIKNQSTLQIVLKEDLRALDEVVVVGYGTQKKVNLTGSVQSLSGKDLLKRNTPNIANALQGLMPGVSVVQTSGQPGADQAGITIRGTGSLNSSVGPLVLIDGIEGNMNNVDMNAVESVSVLKDAASASIYGSRASNGVILITTKRSGEEKVQISYSGYAGINRPTELPEGVSAVGFMEAINTARANGDMGPQYSQELIQQYKTEGADNYYRYDTNWRNEVIKDAAFTQNHSVSLSGGSRHINYFANAGYYFQDGQIANNNYSRLTLRVNTDARVTDWLKVGVDINIRKSKTKRPSILSAASIINCAITYIPVFSGINSDGTWGFGQSGSNPIAISREGGIYQKDTPELGVKGFMQLNPVKGLNASISYSSQSIEGHTGSFRKQYDTYETGAFIASYPVAGQEKSEIWSESVQNQFNAQASYEKNFAKNYLKALVGVQTEELVYKTFSATRLGYDFLGFEEIKHGNVSTATNDGGRSEWAMLSYFGRLNYSFADRYLLELNGRWDASSRFMKNVRWGFFPSMSVGWRISEEAFFEQLKKTVDNLKIRASHGTLGNQDIGDQYPYAAPLETGYGYWFDEEYGSGVAQTQMANQKISWEKSTQFNVGIDVSMWKSRLDLTYDYYVRNINDMLQQLPIPNFVGLSSAWENAGSMRNKGWDLSASWHDKIRDFSYYISGNLSDVKNEVTNLYGNKYVTATTTTIEGYPVHSWFGYVSDGYFQSQEEINNSPVYGGNKENVKPGYIRYKDISGPDGVPDGKIDDNDRKVIGDPFPRYQFGLSLGAEWKGFDFSVFFQGVGKKDILLTGFGARPFYVGRTIFKHQLDTWTPENRNAEFPLLLIEGAAGSNPNNIVSDFWLKSGAYVRLKNLVIGYTLPANVLNKLHTDHLRLYISGQNLFTLSDTYKGYDPESSVSSGDFYPVMQTLTFGIELRF